LLPEGKTQEIFLEIEKLIIKKASGSKHQWLSFFLGRKT